MKTLYVHIGLHKTGTSSIQAFMAAHRTTLLARGVDFLRGLHIDQDHVELHTAALRPERLSFFKHATGLTGTDDYRRIVKQRLEAWASATPAETLVVSAEGLSFLRHDDELDALRDLLPDLPTIILVYLRNGSDWFASYSAETGSHAPLSDAGDPGSIGYLGPGSWLLDFEGRLELFRRAFSMDRVVVTDYDTEVGHRTSVIPSFLDILGVADAFSHADWAGIWRNPRRDKTPFSPVARSSDDPVI